MNEFCSPGHFYSVMPDAASLKKHYENIGVARRPENVRDDCLRGINLNLKEQKELVAKLEGNYATDMRDYIESPTGERRFAPNGVYSCMDAVSLYYMIRDLKPKNIIEIGCGFSSALMLDVNEVYFNNEINITLVDPDFAKLDTLLSEQDKKNDNIKMLNSKTQDLYFEFFDKLERNDILFLDTTHVTKAGSDVNFLIFEVLPRLKSGVHVHFHDIFYPFEVPEAWINNGYYWNENYLLRAFLQNNEQYRIKLFSDLAVNICKFNKRRIIDHHYGVGTQYGGASLWLEKT